MDFDWTKYKKEVEQYYYISNYFNNMDENNLSAQQKQNIEGLKIQAHILNNSINKQYDDFWSNFYKVDACSDVKWQNLFVDANKDYLIEKIKQTFGDDCTKVYFIKAIEDLEEPISSQYDLCDTLCVEIKKDGNVHTFNFPCDEEENVCNIVGCMADVFTKLSENKDKNNDFYIEFKEVLWDAQRNAMLDLIDQRLEFLLPLKKPLTAADEALFKMLESMEKFNEIADDSYNAFVKRYCDYNDFNALQNMFELTDFVYDRKNASKMIKNLEGFKDYLNSFENENVLALGAGK